MSLVPGVGGQTSLDRLFPLTTDHTAVITTLMRLMLGMQWWLWSTGLHGQCHGLRSPLCPPCQLLMLVWYHLPLQSVPQQPLLHNQPLRPQFLRLSAKCTFQVTLLLMSNIEENKCLTSEMILVLQAKHLPITNDSSPLAVNYLSAAEYHGGGVQRLLILTWDSTIEVRLRLTRYRRVSLMLWYVAEL